MEKIGAKNMEIAKKLINNKFGYVASISEEGIPYVRAMLIEKVDGLKEIWLSTAANSKKIEHYAQNSNASVYFADIANYQGLLLTGRIQIDPSKELRKEFWKSYYSSYYPGGINDSQYTILKFVSEKAILYAGDISVDLF